MGEGCWRARGGDRGGRDSPEEGGLRKNSESGSSPGAKRKEATLRVGVAEGKWDPELKRRLLCAWQEEAARRGSRQDRRAEWRELPGIVWPGRTCPPPP